MIGVGIRIIEDENMIEQVGEDWSGARSPARAKRRRNKHRQRIRPIFAPKKNAYQMPDGRGGFVFVMHPTMAAAFRQEMRSRTEKAEWSEPFRENALFRSPWR